MKEFDEVIIDKKVKIKNTDKRFQIKIILGIVGYFILMLVASVLYYETNILWFYLLNNVLFTTIPEIVLIGMITTSIVLFTKFGKEKILLNFDVQSLKVIAIATIMFAILFEGINKQKYIIINYKQPSMLEYKWNILKDAISKETRTTTTDKVETDIVVKSTRTQSTSSRKHNEYYIEYISEDGNKYRYASKEDKILYIAINNWKEYEDELTIEYYKNSGIIKSIDGIEKNDWNKVNDRTNQLIRERQNDEENKKVEQEEARQLNTKRNAILKNAIGKTLESVKNELEVYGEFDFKVEYISSKLYKIGEIAFVKYAYSKDEITTLYVVDSNKTEDMIPMPKLKAGMPEEQAIKMLEESGFKSKVTRFEAVNGEEKGTLKYYQYTPGTLLPKGMVVGFSVNE